MKKLAVCLLLAVAIGGAYYNALGNGFVFDDYLLIVNHRAFQIIADAPAQAFSLPVLGYRPIRTFSYVIDVWLGGMRPWVFHLSNIIYHWLTACLVFLVTLRLMAGGSAVGGQGSGVSFSDFGLRTSDSELRTALFVALLWALHPVQTDAVTYISGRRDVLGGFFLFLGLWSYLRFRTATVRGWPWLLGACVMYGLGLLSKESVLVLPLLCWLADVQTEGVRESLRRRWAVYFLVLGVGVAVLWFLAGPYFWEVFRKLSWHGGSIEGNFATVTRIWVHYLTVMVFPRTLIGDYSYDAFPVSHSFAEPAVLTALGVLGAVALSAWVLARWRSLCGYGALWLLITILPVSHIFPIKEIVAEHYLYVPLFGLCLILGVVLDALCGAGFARQALSARLRATAVYVAVLVLLVAAVTRVIVRNRDWKDEETFWTVTAQTVPRCARTHYNLAGVYKQQKRAQEAAREFAATLAIVPKHVEATVGLGELAFEAGLYGQAFGYATQAQRIAPRNPRVVYLLGWTTLALKRLDDAETYFQKAAALNPNFPGVYAGLEAVAKERGDVAAQDRWARKRRQLEAKKRQMG